MKTRALTLELTTYRPQMTRWPLGLRVQRRAVTGGIALGRIRHAWLLTWQVTR